VDDQYRLEEDAADSAAETDTHSHVTMKSSCPTRWNSCLSMIQSILDMKREVMNSLKRIGKVDMCLHTDEIELLEELGNFLKPFQSFTELVSTATATATVSLVPLIKLQIRKMCSVSESDAVNVNDSPPMKSVKKKILENLDRRFPESDVLKLHRVLDPSTKDVTPKEEAIALLQQAIQRLSQRGLITIQTTQSLNASEFDIDEPASKRRKLKEEMLNELQRSASSTTNEMNNVMMEINNCLSSRYGAVCCMLM